jgi:predicted HicB family RNase H-like nuclease
VAKRGPGRPPKKAEDRRSVTICFRVTDSEHDRLQTGAEQTCQSLSDWIREILIREVGRQGVEIAEENSPTSTPVRGA